MIGIPLGVSLFIFMMKKMKHFLTWIFIPFLFFHSLVPHKELRFLFPFVNFIPFVVVTVLYESKLRIKKSWLLSLIAGFIIFINVFILCLFAVKPSGNGRLHQLRYLHENYQEEEIRVMYEKEFTWVCCMVFYEQDNLKPV